MRRAAEEDLQQATEVRCAWGLRPGPLPHSFLGCIHKCMVKNKLLHVSHMMPSQAMAEEHREALDAARLGGEAHAQARAEVLIDQV